MTWRHMNGITTITWPSSAVFPIASCILFWDQQKGRSLAISLRNWSTGEFRMRSIENTWLQIMTSPDIMPAFCVASKKSNLHDQKWWSVPTSDFYICIHLSYPGPSWRPWQQLNSLQLQVSVRGPLNINLQSGTGSSRRLWVAASTAIIVAVANRWEFPWYKYCHNY